MLDPKFIAANPVAVQANCDARGAKVNISAIVELYRSHRAELQRLEEMRARAKAIASQLRGQRDPALVEEAKELRATEGRQNDTVKRLHEELEERLSWVPNMLDERVPIGDESVNIVVRTVGTPRAFDFAPRPHDEILAGVGGLDQERAVRATKARFYALKNAAVLLRGALVQRFIRMAVPQGFELVSPPVLAKPRTLFASGYLPFAARDNFNIEREGEETLSLIGTSEQILLGLHLDEVLTKLPILYLGDSMCFRTEAGGYGRDTAGIIRVHQFYKLEQFVFCLPQEAERWHQSARRARAASPRGRGRPPCRAPSPRSAPWSDCP